MDLYELRTFTFWSFNLLSLISLAYPWKLSDALARWALHLPLVIALILGIHEWAMPNNLTYRPDLLVIITLGGPVFGAYCFRLCLITEKSGAKPQRPRSFDDLNWEERRALLPFNHESRNEQMAKLHDRA